MVVGDRPPPEGAAVERGASRRGRRGFPGGRGYCRRGRVQGQGEGGNEGGRGADVSEAEAEQAEKGEVAGQGADGGDCARVSRQRAEEACVMVR